MILVYLFVLVVLAAGSHPGALGAFAGWKLPLHLYRRRGRRPAQGERLPQGRQLPARSIPGRQAAVRSWPD